MVVADRRSLYVGDHGGVDSTTFTNREIVVDRAVNNGECSTQRRYPASTTRSTASDLNASEHKSFVRQDRAPVRIGFTSRTSRQDQVVQFDRHPSAGCARRVSKRPLRLPRPYYL